MNTRALFSLLTALALVAAVPASAQVYPSHPITIVVPLAAGGPNDTLARLLAEPMRAVARAARHRRERHRRRRDGRDRPRRPRGGGRLHHRDGIPRHPCAQRRALCAELRRGEGFRSDHAGLQQSPRDRHQGRAAAARTCIELIAWLKLNPDKASAANAGVGTSTHVAGLLLQQAAGVRFQMVPYRGAAPALQDVMGGQVDLMVDVASNSLPYLQGGKIKAYAVTSP